jgi:cellobiose-specific phosphotransferase system component IIC
VNTLRRTLGWIGGAIMVTIFVIAMLAFWPFVRRTESQLKEDAENDN